MIHRARRRLAALWCALTHGGGRVGYHHDTGPFWICDRCARVIR